MSRSHKIFAGAVLLLLAAGCHDSAGVSVLGSKAGPLVMNMGEEGRVNEDTAGDQQLPQIASNGHGNAVVVWESRSPGPDYYDIYARLYKNGQPAGAPFRVNTYTRNRQNLPAVAMDGAGNFVIAWRSSLQSGPGGTIYAQRFAADASRLGEEFRVGPNDSEWDSQSEPAIAMNESGAFVIVWGNRELSEAATRLGQPLETRQIQGSLYAADGTLTRGPYSLMTPTPLAIIRAPSVGMASDGSFAVAWISESRPAGIRLRSFNAAGVGKPTETISNEREDAEMDHPALAMSANGDLAVAWETLFFSGQHDGIYYRRFQAATGVYTAEKKAGFNASGGRFGIGDMEERVAVALNSKGELLIAAQGEDAIYAQLFDAGDLAGMPARLNNENHAAMYPVAVLDEDSRALVVWQSFQQDGDGRGIYARMLGLGQ